MLIAIAEKAFGRRPAFAPNPPGALPYQSLAVDEQGGLVWRRDSSGGSGAPRDALQLAAEAAAEESPRSAAALGAVVTDGEAAAALGGGAGSDDGGGSDGGDEGVCDSRAAL